MTAPLLFLRRADKSVLSLLELLDAGILALGETCLFGAADMTGIPVLFLGMLLFREGAGFSRVSFEVPWDVCAFDLAACWLLDGPFPDNRISGRLGRFLTFPTSPKITMSWNHKKNEVRDFSDKTSGSVSIYFKNIHWGKAELRNIVRRVSWDQDKIYILKVLKNIWKHDRTHDWHF